MVVDSNGTLIIRDTSVEDSGDYSCAANSRAGRASATSPLVVTGETHRVDNVASYFYLFYLYQYTAYNCRSHHERIKLHFQVAFRLEREFLEDILPV